MLNFTDYEREQLAKRIGDGYRPGEGKFDPNHDQSGRFASSGYLSGIYKNPKSSKLGKWKALRGLFSPKSGNLHVWDFDDMEHHWAEHPGAIGSDAHDTSLLRVSAFKDGNKIVVSLT
jgi:hypothetical protein